MSKLYSFLSASGRLSWSFYVLLLILVVALGLRLNGVNWDQGFGFHPDERDIYMRSGCMYDLLTTAPDAEQCGYVHAQPDAEPGLPSIGTLLDIDRSPLNPHWFPLGSILIYCMVFLRSVAEIFTDLNPFDMRYFGRPLSALADVGTVAMVFIIGRKFYGTGTGLLAAGLTAVAVIHIQHSHFFRPETFSVFFTLASFLAMWRMLERKRLRDSAVLGLLLGLAIAPKVSILPVLAPLILVYWYRVLDEVEDRWANITPGLVGRIVGHAALAVVVASGVFFISAPYAILDFGSFADDLSAQTMMASNAGLWPFTIQYVGTPAFVYQIQQSSVWGLGLPLGVVAWASIPFTAALAVISKKNRRVDLFLLAWVVPGFIFLETFEVHFLRYVFPLIPAMIILGSRMLLWMVSTFELLPVHRVNSFLDKALITRAFAIGVIVFVVAATGFYALAFQQVYAKDHPAISASEWINTNVPPGTGIVSDNHWDEFVPNLYAYDLWQFPVYEADTLEKMKTLARKLAVSEYVVFYSSRPYTSTARDPLRFPLSNQYYQRLFGGDLGYELDREFTNYPSLFGVTFRDDAIGRAGLETPVPLNPTERSGFGLDLGYADDNVVGYDHPKVLLFKNTGHLDESIINVRLKTISHQTREADVGLILSPDGLASQQGGGTFSEMFDRDGWTNHLPVIAWILVLEIVYLAALPFTMFIFRPLPDRGIVLARILGLLLVSYLAWISVSVGIMDYSVWSIYLGLCVVAMLSVAVLLAIWGEIVRFFREHWRLLLFGEVLFLAAFLGFVLLRYLNPDLWHPFRGGEKPMELAYLNAVVRSTTLPPFDPWFAGGLLNYYYWGYFVVSNIIKVSGILPYIAFNLAVPMFFALTITGAYSVVYNLTEGLRKRQVISQESALPGVNFSMPGADRLPRWRRWVWSPVTAGITAGIFVSVIGNLDGMLQIIQNTWNLIVNDTPIPGFDFWRGSRMLPNLEQIDPNVLAFWVPAEILEHSEVSFHITEFPFFTFLFADLHAHMMVIPFTLLVIGLGLNVVVGLKSGNAIWVFTTLITLALGLGSLWVVNSWDFPPYVILAVALLLLAVYLPDRTVVSRLALFVSLAIGVIATAILAFLPFHQTYETFNNGLDVSLWRTPVDRFLGIHGLFLFVIMSFLLYQARDIIWDLVRNVRYPGNSSVTPGIWWMKICVGIGFLCAAFFAFAGFWTVTLLFVFLILTVIVAWKVFTSKYTDRAYEAVPLVLLSLALFIGIGVDLVRVEGDIGRMNTLFKYYIEIWVLLSVVSAYMLWRLGTTEFLRPAFTAASSIWVLVLMVLVGSSLIYTMLGTKARLADRFTQGSFSLNGMAYMADATHEEQGQLIELKWDQEAIEWIQDTVEGSPVILEAHLSQYHWGARFSAYTGLPTVIGWPWHQVQQRTDYSFAVDDRIDDVREIYETLNSERALELIRQYRIQYVVVGDLERMTYQKEGLLKFESMGNKVFENFGTIIYKVK